MRALLFLLLLTRMQAAVVITSYGPSGLTLPFNTTTSFGVYSYMLPGSDFNHNLGPEFNLVFALNDLVIERNTDYNKNSKVVGFFGPDWDGTASRLALGDTVEWQQYAGHNHLRWDWKPGVTGYLGLLVNPENDGDPQNYYSGWLHVRWNANSSITLLDAGYETDIGRPCTIVPEPRVLVLIGGLALLRRKRT